MSSLARATVPLALLALLVGCKSNNIKTSEDNDYATELVGSEGAKLTLDDGTSLYIPADALTEAQEVQLGRVSSGYPAFQNISVKGGVYSIEPHELAFEVSATLSVPGSQGVLNFAPEGGPWTALQTVAQMGTLSADTMQGGFFAVDTSGKVDSGTPGDGLSNTAGFDGELVRTGVTISSGSFVFGDSFMFSIQTVVDGFGAETTTLQAVPLVEGGAPVTVATLSDMSAGMGNVTAIGDYVYWATPPQPGQPGQGSSEVYRATPGEAPELLGKSASMTLAASAGSLLFIDSTSQVARYDAVEGMLDETMYGALEDQPVAMGTSAPFTSSDDHVFFLTGGGSAPFEIWAGPIGSPATDTGINFPAGAMLVGMGAVGSTLVIVTSVGVQNNVITFDTANPGDPKTVASFAGGGVGASEMLAIADGAVYAAVYVEGSNTGELLKIDVNDGAQTKLGTYLAAGLMRPIRINSQYIFMIEPTQMGSDLYRWAR